MLNADKKINEEEIEESLEELGLRKRSTGKSKQSKGSSIQFSTGSIPNLQKSSVNKENNAVEHLPSDSEHSSKNEIPKFDERFSSPSDKIASDPIRGKELLTITVEIGNGQRENIIIFENDDAEQVSEVFCKKHNIKDELKEIFTNQIADNIIQVKEEIAMEQGEDKFASAPHVDNYREISPPSIEQPVFNDIM